MKIIGHLLLSLFVLTQSAAGLAAERVPELTCGDTITEDTVLVEDLSCPDDAEFAIIIGASNITLDLGGHTISGTSPSKGVFASDQEGIIIRNGSIDGFHDGVFLNNTRQVTVENLTVRNLDFSDPVLFIFGITIVGSQEVIVRDSLFEFVEVFHKEAVEVYDSTVDVSNIEMRGGGTGVNFSYAGEACDPLNSPSNGTVRNSRFTDVLLGGILVACSSYAWIEGNTISSGYAGGINGSGPFPGAVTGLVVKGNVIRDDYYTAIDIGGSSGSTVLNNIVSGNYFGISLGPSLGCLNPETGWECFYSTGNVIADNQTFGNAIDLYHHESSLGNTWEGNTCETREGVEIPECLPPTALLMVNYASGKPGSFFTIEGANFPISDTTTITVNGILLGTVPTDSSGDLVFLLNTDQADEGEYIVTAEVNPSASVKFVLDASRWIRLQEGEGTIFNVPGGLFPPSFFFLPVVRK